MADDIVAWITENGTHIPIHKGESKADAVKRANSKHGTNKPEHRPEDEKVAKIESGDPGTTKHGDRIDFTNFHHETSGRFTSAVPPDREADYTSESHGQYGKSLSKYWDVGHGVVRQSDHWSGDRSNDKRVKGPLTGYINSVWWEHSDKRPYLDNTKKNVRTGYIPYSELDVSGVSKEYWANKKHTGVNMMIAEFNLSLSPTLPLNHVLRTGKIFQVGNYPDKDFSLSEAEADAAVTAFKPGPLNVEHAPSIFDGKLGEVRRIWREGVDLFGEYSIPRWLHDEFIGNGDPIKISSEWDRETKLVLGAALVLHPRVTDAAIMAAFTAHEDAGSPGRKDKPMTVWEKIKAAFSDAGIDTEAEVPKVKDSPAPAATVVGMSAEDKAKFDAQAKELSDLKGLVTTMVQTQQVSMAQSQTNEAERRVQAALKAFKIFPSQRAPQLLELAKTNFAEFSIRMDEIEKGRPNLSLGGYSPDTALAVGGIVDETSDFSKEVKKRADEKKISFSDAAYEITQERPDLARAVYENRSVMTVEG